MYLERFEPTCVGDVIDVVKTNRVFIKTTNFIGVDYCVGQFAASVSFVGLTKNDYLRVGYSNYDDKTEYYKLSGNFDAIELPKIVEELMKG